MISNSKPTEPEPEQSQDGNIHLTDPERAGEGNADMANAGMANDGMANAGTGIGEPRPLQIEPEPEFWPEPHPSPDQRRQTGGNKPTAINQVGQQTSLQKVPQGQLLKLKWSTEKRHAVGFRAWLGMEKPEDPRSWGSHDELEAIAKMYNVSFIVFESAQAAGSQKISIGEEDSPTIFLINTDNQHFDILVPQVDGNYSRLKQPEDGNCMYHSVIPGLLKFIPEHKRNIHTPSCVRAALEKWIADDTNFQSEAKDGADQIALHTREQLDLQASN